MFKVLIGSLTFILSYSSLRDTSTSIKNTNLIDKTHLVPWTEGSEKCTSIIVSKGAGTEGPMTTHTADCANCDFRINKVPAKDWKKDDKRALYVYKGSYPSQVIEGRGTTWSPSNLEGSAEQIEAWLKEEKDITGYIPQVPHTYALYEAGYGIMNEHGLAMGESTCASWLWAAPTTAGGKAQVEVRELSKIALERTTKAREAIQLMGDLAVKLGYYSAEWVGGDESRGEGGEALTVIDKNEAWVFHVTSDDTGTSAVWVAQRVPDGEVAVVANQFIIRDVIKGSDDFMYSENLWEVAERVGLWSPSQGTLDFLKTYGPQRMHSPYATRRVWRVFTLLDPTLDLPAETDSYASNYPFSVKPTIGKLSKHDLMRLQRDHYEGSAYDLTKGLQSGPYGDPERWDAAPSAEMSLIDVMQGSFERAISLFRTSYSFVAVSRSNLPDTIAPVMWFTQYAPASSSYTPFYVSSNDAPRPYTKGSLFKYDPTVSFWNFAAAGNWANRWYIHTIGTIQSLQNQLESGYDRELENTDSLAIEVYESCKKDPTCNVESSNKAVIDLLTSFTFAKGQQTVDAWRELLPKLITQFHDGYNAQNLNGAEISMKKLFYPKWWLDAVGYFENGPNRDPKAIMFAPRNDPSSTLASTESASLYTSGFIATVLMASIFSVIAGFILGRRTQGHRAEYMVIDL